MRPVSGSPVFRPDLGQYVAEYMEGASLAFVGLQVMPPYPVADAAGEYPVLPKEALLSIEQIARSPRSSYNRSTWEYEIGKYSTSEKGHEEPVDDSERKLLDRRSPGMADRVATQRNMNIILRAQEKRIADLLFNTSNFSVHNLTDEWDDATNGKPIQDVNDATSAFRTQCGMLPDVLLITWTTFQKLKENDEIVGRLKYTFPGIDINRMSSDQLAAVFNVPRVLVAGAVYNSSGKNVAANITDVWSNEYAALMKVGAGDDLVQPCVGRTFYWAEDSQAEPLVEVYREEQIRSDVYRIRHYVDENLIRSYDSTGTVVSDIAGACMYLIGNVNTI